MAFGRFFSALFFILVSPSITSTTTTTTLLTPKKPFVLFTPNLLMTSRLIYFPISHRLAHFHVLRPPHRFLLNNLLLPALIRQKLLAERSEIVRSFKEARANQASVKIVELVTSEVNVASHA